MTALAGASGFRAWLQNRGWAWLTPKRLKRATVDRYLALWGLNHDASMSHFA